MRLKDYIRGKRHGKEANQLEREAMNDPFLQDAMDGFDAVSGDHFAEIEELENKLQSKQFSKKKTIHYRWWTIAVAASIVLIVGIGGLLQFNFNSPHKIVMESPKQDSTPEKILTDKNEISIDTAEDLSEKNIAQNVDNKSKRNKSKPHDIELIVEENKYNVVEAAQDKIELQSATIADIQTADNMEHDEASPVLASSPAPKLSGNKLTGVVLDDKGEPLIGANVQLKGTNIKTITDINGKFELTTPKVKEKDLQLVASYIGFNNREISATSDSNVIKMEPNNLALNEVVVVGYGTKKMTSTTGAVSRVSTTNNFGENDFEIYYKKNRNQELCETFNTILKANFYIDNMGRPTEIKVEKAPCLEMEQEFIKLAQNSPRWTKKNQKIRITIRF